MPNDKKRLIDLDLNGNELQNGVIQNLATAPNNPKEGQIYHNTATHTTYIYANGQWVDALVQGASYTEGTGIDIAGTTISVDTTVIATKTDLGDYIADTEKGANGGVATLDSSGKVPNSQLPAYVDDVIDSYIVSGATAFSAGWLSATDGGTAFTPETGKIYVVLSSGSYQNKTYRWSGTTYVEISQSPGQATESASGIAELATQSEVNTGTDDTRIVTPLKLATKISGMTKKIAENNTSLTASSGVCTWTITNTLGTADVQVVIKEVSSNAEVVAGVVATSSTITITINSSSNIAADTYRAIIIG